MWAGMMKAGSASLWLTAGAAQAWTIMVAGLVWLFRDRLTDEQAFWIIIGAQCVTSLSLAALAGQQMTLSIGKGGLTANVGRDDDLPPIQPPADDGELPPDQRVRR
jgi:hypothetical protein